MPSPEDPRFVSGYDLDNVVGAEAYLSEQHELERPRPRFHTDLDTDYHITWAVTHVKRAALYEGEESKANGRRQNDAEHTFALIDTALVFIEKQGLDLDIGVVVTKFTRHDRVEGYSDDTSILDPIALAHKQPRERAGRTLQKQDSNHTPKLAASDAEYEMLLTEEDKFVYAWDGIEPVKFAQYTDLALQKERGDNFREMVYKILRKTAFHPAVFAQAQKELRIVSSMWDACECMPFQGDGYEIISETVQMVLEERRQAAEIAAQTTGKLAVLAEYRDRRRDHPNPPTPPGGAALHVDTQASDFSEARGRATG